MINISTGRNEPNFVNIYKYINHVWSKDLPFNKTYRLILMQRLEKLRILSKNEFCYPSKLIGVLKIEGIQEKIPETTRKILLAGLLAMEDQIGRQEELYGASEDVFYADQGKKKHVIYINKSRIYDGFRIKMENGLFFMVTGNKTYNGGFSFNDDSIDDILANYSTLPMLENEDYSEFDKLFVEVPKGYSVRYKKKR